MSTPHSIGINVALGAIDLLLGYALVRELQYLHSIGPVSPIFPVISPINPPPPPKCSIPGFPDPLILPKSWLSQYKIEPNNHVVVQGWKCEAVYEYVGQLGAKYYTIIFVTVKNAEQGLGPYNFGLPDFKLDNCQISFTEDANLGVRGRHF